MMNTVSTHVSMILSRPASGLNSLCCELQQWRGIRVQVRNGNLEQALGLVQRKMQSSGIERLIKREQTHHIKNSEKRVIARKALERKLRSQDFARKLKSILVKKVRSKRLKEFHLPRLVLMLMSSQAQSKFGLIGIKSLKEFIVGSETGLATVFVCLDVSKLKSTLLSKYGTENFESMYD